MRHRKHALIGLAALLLLAGALVILEGCGRPAQQSNVIQVTRNIGGREGFRRHFEVWKATFEAKNPGWVMELVDLGNAEGAEFYKSRIATDSLPEVVMTWEMAPLLADSGHLVPLPDSYYDQFGIPLPAPYKGQRYTSQAGRQIQGIVINKKMWDDIGVSEAPATWDDFFAALHALKKKGYKPLVLGGREWSAAQPMGYAIASDLYDRVIEPGSRSWTKRRDAGEVRFATDPVARHIMEMMVYLVDNFVEKGALSDGYNEEQRDFYGGKGATWMMGCWMAGDIESNQVPFEMAYWPIPSFQGRPPVFMLTSGVPNGWAVTTSATGEKRAKAIAALETFYDPKVYQEFLNGECQFGQADKVAAKAPQYAWPPAQRLIENMSANLEKYGATRGFHIALDDMVPLAFYNIMSRIMQEIMAGNHDVDKLLETLDDDWDRARKGV